ncbi:phage major tail protein, TP901-1 family [Cytobacillus kochii]|uniref:phage major tail protein, TP901-1 family n=1 Tax=Cytobacillus kochii TaxID=859143 RepID=UPI001CD62CC3|nr:phage major tail protein, TP901-1 family [Cytobacillus kochii]MCA1025786.1 phage major tail protein, TP901-1 family [Cytobacillus kochii]
MAENGINFTISIDGTKVAGQRGGSLSRSADTIETTSKDGAGWKSFIPSFKEWSVEGDGVVVFSDEGFALIEQAYVSGDAVEVDVQMNGTKSIYNGEAIINDFSVEMPYDDLMSYSISLQGTGALTFVNPSTLL